jgi:DNA-binding transcriptional LysR family regulator
MDLLFRVESVKDRSLVVKKVLSYRHQVLASPAYLRTHPTPQSPQELREHRLLAFSHWRPENTCEFARVDSREKRSLIFAPYFSMNDYVGLATALLDGYGVGELPPVVLPHLVREGKLVEIMPQWRMRRFDLTVAHLGNRHLSRVVRVFKEFALKIVPTLFPELPV